MLQHNDPEFTVVSVVILALLGMLAWSGPALESARPREATPSSTETMGGGESVPARLWQDPFSAIRSHHLRDPQKTPFPATVDELVRRVATDVELRRSAPPAQPAGAALLREIREVAREHDSLVLLLAPVDTKLFAESEERRRRRRYAILSGLGDAHFVPRNEESIGVFEYAGGDATCPCEDLSSLPRVAYEWFELERQKPATPASAVLTLWLDDAWLQESPFQRLHCLISHLTSEVEKKERVRAIMLGPHGSTTLRGMVEDAGDRNSVLRDLHERSGLDAFHILSPLATVADCELDQDRCAPRRSEGDGARASPSALLGPYFEPDRSKVEPAAARRTPLRFLRTIRSDAELLDALAAELVRRRVGPDDTVIVISEWDTYFGRSLPHAFHAALKKRLRTEPKLRRYTYERGIDGIAEGQPAPPSKQEQEPTGLRKWLEASSIERPFGDGQLDYLRRLAKTIRDDNEELRLTTGRGVKAVAVLGSDIYDKLLILRALRDELPGAIWLTTDLDAHLLHPAEFSWTRNLVVASSFDLELGSSMHGSTPPFRDSYQTAVYLATRMAVEHGLVQHTWCDRGACLPGESLPGQEAMYDSLPPLLFEIGRNGAVALEPTSHEREMLHGGEPNGPVTHDHPDRSAVLAYLIGGFLVCVGAVFALHQLRPQSGGSVIAFGSLVLAIGGLLLLALAKAPGGEPLSMRQGVSVWPTVIIRVLIVGLVVWFIDVVLARLDANWRELNVRFFGGKEILERAAGYTLSDVARIARTWSRVHVRPWGVGIATLFAVLVFAVPRLREQSLNVVQLLAAQGAAFTMLVAGWWAFIYGKIHSDVKVRSVNEWLTSRKEGDAATLRQRYGEERDAATLWQHYRDYGDAQHRILRSAAATLLYFAMSSVLFTLLGGGAAPCRGDACRIHAFVLGVSVLLMLFLLFLVVDAIRLCVAWIVKFRDRDVVWEGNSVDKVARERGLPLAHAAYWQQVHLIGERTSEVGRLLYYPLVVILLMLLARSTYFDAWDFPLALTLVVGLNFAIALSAAAVLTRAARNARGDILDRLRAERVELSSDTDKPLVAPSPAEIDSLIDRLANLKLGAYQGAWEQPLVRASLLLMAGLLLTYAEYTRASS